MSANIFKIERFPTWKVATIVVIGLILIFLVLQLSGLYRISFLQSFFPEKYTFSLTDVTTQAEIQSFKRSIINRDNPDYLEIMGGGVAVADIDGDGWEDIFFADMSPIDSTVKEPMSSSRLFKNRGDGTFEDVTIERGLDRISGYPIGALFLDYNNDGKQDLYVAAYDGGELFRNDGNSFTNVTDSAGLNLQGMCGETPCLTAAASTADYDRDGYLDLLIVNNVEWEIDNPNNRGHGTLVPIHYPAQPSFLYKNNGDGTFTNVSEQSMITNQDQRGHREDGKGLSAVWSDFNNDNWPDLYIANDMSPNRLYINKKDGTFSEIAIAAYLAESKSSMGIDAGDFNQDGYMDLLTTNLIGQMTSLFQNYGNLRFDYVTYNTGIMPTERVSGWGILFVDMNLDGYQDIAMGSGALWNRENSLENRNLVFQNRGNGTFRNATDEVIDFYNSAITRGLAVIDFDRSGTPDLIYSNIDGKASQLVKNNTSGHNWIRLDLEGVQSNRDAIGATVTLNRKDSLQQIQTVKAGNSYVSTSSKSLFFGLGNSTVDNLKIQWPSGQLDTLKSVEINKILHIKEGVGISEQE